MSKTLRDKVREFKEEITEGYKFAINKANTSSTDFYNFLVSASEEVSSIKNKVTSLGDMITDLKILKGDVRYNKYLSICSIVASKNIIVRDDKFQLEYIKTNEQNPHYESSVITSGMTYNIKDKKSRDSTLSSLLRESNKITLQFNKDPFNFEIVLKYIKPVQINTINIGLGLETGVYPEITSIKYLNSNSEEIECLILENNSRSYSLAENRKVNNDYTLNINPITTDQLIIGFSGAEGEQVTFEKLKTYLTQQATEGYIIVGPVKSNSSILKVALNSIKETKGASVFVSTDKEYWIEIENSNKIAKGENGRKILALNTVGNNSIKTSEDIFNLYFKIVLKSSSLDNTDIENMAYNSHREDSVIENERFNDVEEDKLSVYRLKNSDYYYGKYYYNSTVNFSKFDYSNIEYLDREGSQKVLGLASTPFSINVNNADNIYLGELGAELRVKQLPSDPIILANNFDPVNSEIYEIYLRTVNNEFNINLKENWGFPLLVAEDIYKIEGESTRSFLTIDLTTPYIKNSSAAIINVNYENIIIKNSLGKLVKKVLKEDLDTLIKEGITYYFLNLTGILIELPKVNLIDRLGNKVLQSYNRLYPLVSLSNNEYGLDKGKIISNTSSILEVEGKEVLKTKIKVNRVISKNNLNYLKRVDKEAYYFEKFEVDEIEGIKTIKLNHYSIEKSSVNIKDKTSSQYLYKEVDFKDGNAEFYRSNYVTNLLQKNVNEFNLSETPEEDSIKFSGDVRLFKKRVYREEDLSIEGSWYYDVINNKIKINENLKTSSTTNTVVTYISVLREKESNLYSVDIDKGVVYLSTPVKNVEIEYKHSILFVEGQRMEQVPGEVYEKNTMYNVPVSSDTKLVYTYQLKETPVDVNSIEYIEGLRVSLITLEDKDE